MFNQRFLVHRGAPADAEQRARLLRRVRDRGLQVLREVQLQAQAAVQGLDLVHEEGGHCFLQERQG